MDETIFITSVQFNLGGESGTEKVNGRVSFFSERAELETNGEKTTVQLAGVKEFVCRAGVGSVSIEASFESGDTLICRSTMTYMKTFSLCVKRLNKALSGYKPAADWNTYRPQLCTKCHRLLPPGSTLDTCPRCSKKMGYMKRLFEVAKPYSGYIIASVVIYFIFAALSLVVPYLNKVLVDDYIKAETMPSASQYILVIAMILGVQLVQRILTMTRTVTQTVGGNKVIVRLRQLVFSKIEALSISGVSKRTSGELINRVSNDTRQIQSFLTEISGTLIENVLTLVAVGVVLFTYDWRLALLILLPTPLVVVINRVVHRMLHKHYHRQWVTGSRVNTVLYDIISGIRVVKSFGMEKDEMKRFDKEISDEAQTCTDNESISAVAWPLNNALLGIGEFFILYFVGTRIISGEMTLGEMQQFSAYTALIYGPLNWLSHAPQWITRTATSVVKVFEIMDEKQDVTDKENAIEKDIGGDIEINNVSFGYEDAKGVLKNVSLSIKPGEMIGVVGRSGVGKSTLINLIMRLYDPDEGSITIDGTDIREISQHSLRSQMGVVLQDTMLFSGTLFENIAYSKPTATADEIITAAKISGVHTFAVRLPDGYDTIIGERGYTLSGGERQRVAIARALLHDPKVLILDEATSSLDTETEKSIQDALQKLIAGRTTIAIAHRLSTLRNATRLVVLDAGGVAEVGTHDELMRKKGIYFGLVMAQRQMSKMA